MSSKWKVVRATHEVNYLDILRRHFPDVTTFEKHPDAMLNIFFTEAYDSVCGKNFQKEKISKRKQSKIRLKFLERLRNKYGRWISLEMKFISSEKIRFQTNFQRAYKIKSLGIIYGSPSRTSVGNIFYTSHCFERFEERVPKELYLLFLDTLEGKYGKLTSADIIIVFMMISSEYALKDNFCYVNIDFGVIVLEIIESEIYIAKTFLTPQMVHPELVWYQSLLNPHQKRELTSFSEFIGSERIQITQPKFLPTEKLMTILQLLSQAES